jgi:hypothetical protein
VTLPLIFLVSIVKLRTMPLPFTKALFCGLGSIPLKLCALILAVTRFPKYTKECQYIFGGRVHDRFWLFKELWK